MHLAPHPLLRYAEARASDEDWKDVDILRMHANSRVPAEGVAHALEEVCEIVTARHGQARRLEDACVDLVDGYEDELTRAASANVADRQRLLEQVCKQELCDDEL